MTLIKLISNFFVDNWIILTVSTITLVLVLLKKPVNDIRQKYFARFLHQMAEIKIERYDAIKKNLFSSLVNIESHDPQLKKEKALKILEVGVGTGMNFKYFPKGTRLVCVDPNPHFDEYYNENRAKFPNIYSEETIVCNGEEMDMIESNSIDVVVMTLVLCSVIDTTKVLEQVKRVLVPGGMFYFLEHVQEFDSEKYRLRLLVQDILTGLRISPTLGHGCCLNRKTLEDVTSAGFSNVEGENFYAPFIGAWWFWCIIPHAKGVATK